MTKHRMPIASLLLVALLAAPRARAADGDVPFRVERLARDVYAVIQLDPLGLANHANTVFVVNEDDVVVVDTQFTLERTRAVLAAIRDVTSKPVGVVVTTHWHDDHVFGNQVYAEAFPGVEFVMQEQTRDDLATLGADNRAQQVAGGEAALSGFRDALASGRALDGSPLADDERAAYASTLAVAGEYLADMPAFAPPAATRSFDDELVLTRGARTIRLLHLGPGVTRGDTVVWLPDDGVLVAGDLVDDPIPFAYRCDVAGWIAALETIDALHPKLIVPGHGSVQHDDAQVVRLRTLLASLRTQTRAALARGETLDEAVASVDTDAFRDAFTGDGEMRRFLFDAFLVGPAVASAYAEAQDDAGDGR
ncbi:MAG: MBL fold metallo-hydrolase [Planctomycetes bacterium]|nr:MBL fold metallo-hydrolase [Planctomycetota bacterium]